MKHILLFITLFILSQSPSLYAQKEQTSVALSGNGYVVGNMDGAQINKQGASSWTADDSQIAAFFRLSKTGKLKVSLRAKNPTGKSQLAVEVANKTFNVTVDSDDWSIVPVGTVKVKEPGYVTLLISGKKKKGEQFAEISDVIIEGEAAQEPMNFVRDFSDYWGRRGPSVHLKYTQPQEDVEYFYNEITVPFDQDPIGSYFMANGFGEGYFGMQVNSEHERRVLFSVWSPFDTQDPKLIPEEDRIVLLRKGEGVHVGEFGNEGSGGQSYLVYPWESGKTYRFLTQIKPDGNGNTIYTAYFYAANESSWRLIASFKRPKTDTWYKGAHSFLENFVPENGFVPRSVFFSNQWARTVKGEWIELDEATFTYDATAAKQVRMDYGGGESKEHFFLQNGGFFNKYTPYQTVFKRKKSGQQPKVNLQFLEELPSVQ